MKEYEFFGMDPGIYRPHEIPVYGVALVYKRLDNAVAKYLNQFNLSVIKFNVLAIIQYQGGDQGISQVEISKRVIVGASNIARLLERMEAEGLIKRYPHKTDRRVNLVRNTEKAEKLIKRLWNGYDEVVKGLAAKLTRKEQKAAARLMANWFVKLKN
ncbi:MAG: winged helix-turn-helix transcriptional regulator [Elusimicrobia bacterium]|nr:winged helix-turn-helix transcriptional regulator [Elusimicrobiota bacterium]